MHMRKSIGEHSYEWKLREYYALESSRVEKMIIIILLTAAYMWRCARLQLTLWEIANECRLSERTQYRNRGSKGRNEKRERERNKRNEEKRWNEREEKSTALTMNMNVDTLNIGERMHTKRNRFNRKILFSRLYHIPRKKNSNHNYSCTRVQQPHHTISES